MTSIRRTFVIQLPAAVAAFLVGGFTVLWTRADVICDTFGSGGPGAYALANSPQSGELASWPLFLRGWSLVLIAGTLGHLIWTRVRPGRRPSWLISVLLALTPYAALVVVLRLITAGAIGGYRECADAIPISGVPLIALMLAPILAFVVPAIRRSVGDGSGPGADADSWSKRDAGQIESRA